MLGWFLIFFILFLIFFMLFLAMSVWLLLVWFDVFFLLDWLEVLFFEWDGERRQVDELPLFVASYDTIETVVFGSQFDHMVELLPLILDFQVYQVTKPFIGLEQLDSTGLLGNFFAMQHIGRLLNSEQGHSNRKTHQGHRVDRRELSLKGLGNENGNTGSR